MAETLTTISPITNEPIVTRTGATREELAALPRTAQEAFKTFHKSTTLGQRQQIVSKALSLLAAKKDVLSREITEQMGRPIAYTGVEVSTAIKRGEFLNRVAGEVLSTTQGDAEPGFQRYIKKEPVGVVLIIFPWNVRFYPLYTYLPVQNAN